MNFRYFRLVFLFGVLIAANTGGNALDVSPEQLAKIFIGHAFGKGGIEVEWNVVKEYEPDVSLLKEIDSEIERIENLRINPEDKKRFIELRRAELTKESEGGRREFTAKMSTGGIDRSYAEYGEFANLKAKYYFHKGLVYWENSNSMASIQSNVDGLYSSTAFGIPSLRVLHYVKALESITLKDPVSGYVAMSGTMSGGRMIEMNLEESSWAPVDIKIFRSNGDMIETLLVTERGDDPSLPRVIEKVFYGSGNSVRWRERITLSNVRPVKIESIPPFKLRPGLRIQDNTVDPPVTFMSDDILDGGKAHIK